MARLSPFFYIFLRILIYRSKHRRRVVGLFHSKERYKNEKAKEAQALKSYFWSASFPCGGGGREGAQMAVSLHFPRKVNFNLNISIS